MCLLWTKSPRFFTTQALISNSYTQFKWDLLYQKCLPHTYDQYAFGPQCRKNVLFGWDFSSQNESLGEVRDLAPGKVCFSPIGIMRRKS